jgi:ABC-type glutathione transport system ATPase component
VQLLEQPGVAYTQRLVAATPRVGRTLNELLPPSERAAFAREAPKQQDVEALGPVDTTPLLEVRGLSKTFEADGRNGFVTRWLRQIRGADQEATNKRGQIAVPAVRNVSFTLKPGARLGIVGESGSGKTTTSRMIARLLDQTEGAITFKGRAQLAFQSLFAAAPYPGGLSGSAGQPQSALHRLSGHSQSAAPGGAFDFTGCGARARHGCCQTGGL